jgi:hypothetical protein
MKITTKTFNITPKELRNLLATQYFQQRRNTLFIYAALILVNLLLPGEGTYKSFTVYILIGFVYLLIAPFILNLKKIMPVLNFVARYWEIDENFIAIHYEDGSLSKFKFEHLVKVTKQKEYYLLYITAAGQFNYLPIAAFETEKDIHRFDLFLQGKQLIKIW